MLTTSAWDRSGARAAVELYKYTAVIKRNFDKQLELLRIYSLSVRVQPHVQILTLPPLGLGILETT